MNPPDHASLAREWERIANGSGSLPTEPTGAASLVLSELFRLGNAIVPVRALLPPFLPAGAWEEASSLGLVATWVRGDGTWATLTPLGETLAEDHGVELIEPVEPVGDEDVQRWDHRGKPPRPLKAERIGRAVRIGYPEQLVHRGPGVFELVTDAEGHVKTDTHGLPAYRFVGIVREIRARKRAKAG